MRLNARFSSIRVNAAASLVETAADLADARLKDEGLWTSRIRILNGGFGARTDDPGPHCPYGRSGAKIYRPAAANIYETPHIGRRAGLHRYGRIPRAVYPSRNKPERQT